MMKQRDTNEILALKFSYISYVVKQAAKAYQQQDAALEEGAALGSWIKHLLKVDSDGMCVNQDRLVQSMLKEFPYVECQLIHQIVRTITSSHGNISALNVLTSCINGQRFASAEDKVCSTCGDLNAKTCQVCKSVFYCNRDCQKLHWFIHKSQCKWLAAEYEKQRLMEENRKKLEAAEADSGKQGNEDDKENSGKSEQNNENAVTSDAQ
jgi:hypothetical protein